MPLIIQGLTSHDLSGTNSCRHLSRCGEVYQDIEIVLYFEYVSSFLCGQVTFTSEVNLADKCDQECYIIHEKIYP